MTYSRHGEIALGSICVIGEKLPEVAQQLDGGSRVQIRRFPPVLAERNLRWLAESQHNKSEIGVGAAGCALAHEQVWQWVSSLSTGPSVLHLVLEDDAIGTTDWLPRLHSTIDVAISSGFDLTHLGRVPSQNASGKLGDFARSLLRSTTIANAGESGLDLRFLRGFGWRTHAYLISERLASSLTEHPLPLRIPVDQFLLEESQKPLFKAKFSPHTVFPGIFSTNGRTSMVDELGR